jgi:hypothetical protein
MDCHKQHHLFWEEYAKAVMDMMELQNILAFLLKLGYHEENSKSFIGT